MFETQQNKLIKLGFYISELKAFLCQMPNAKKYTARKKNIETFPNMKEIF